MKKNYIKPDVVVTVLDVESVMDGARVSGINPGSGETSKPTEAGGEGGAAEADAKEHTSWGMWEDDDFES